MADLGTEYAGWKADRERVSAQEATGDYPPASDWQNSDDIAVVLLEAYATTAHALADALRPGTLSDLGPHLTCSEADALADFLRTLGYDSSVTDLLDSHTRSDEPGDTHYQGDR